MTEPKPLPSETKLVETPSFVKLIANMEEEFRKHDDWVERACVMLKQAAERIRTQDAALASLADELRLAREDAARYRWLRDSGPGLDSYWVAHGIIATLSHWKGEHLDAAVDAALKEPR